MCQISAKFVIKVVGCSAFAAFPPPARTHLPPTRPHSPLYSAKTAGLSAATLTNDSLTAVRIRRYRNIHCLCKAVLVQVLQTLYTVPTARQRRFHYYRCRLTLLAYLYKLCYQLIDACNQYNQQDWHVVRVRGMCADGVDAYVFALETVRRINCGFQKDFGQNNPSLCV